MPGAFRFLLGFLNGKVFGVVVLLILRALYNYGHFVWGVWNRFLLGKAKKEDVPCRFCGKRDGDGHLFWECPSPLPSSMFGNSL